MNTSEFIPGAELSTCDVFDFLRLSHLDTTIAWIALDPLRLSFSAVVAPLESHPSELERSPQYTTTANLFPPPGVVPSPRSHLSRHAIPLPKTFSWTEPELAVRVLEALRPVAFACSMVNYNLHHGSGTTDPCS